MATRCSTEISKSAALTGCKITHVVLARTRRIKDWYRVMNTSPRRKFLKTLGIAAIVDHLSLKSALARDHPLTGEPLRLPFDLGIASYTFRMFPLDKVIEMTARLGVRKLTLKDMHLPFQTSEADIKSIRERISTAGLVLASAGVVYMKSEEEVRNAFSYAKMAGLRLMVGAPEPGLLATVEQYVKETGIALAIHNHGPTDESYPSPESIHTRIAAMDKRVGLCIDIGHTQRLGLDPSSEFERFADRVLDVHIKDVSSADASGTTVEIGRGVIDIPGFLATLVRLRYSGTLQFEFEKDEQDPLPGLAESVGYVKGVLAALDFHDHKER
jgi:inosose dehydratase